MGLHSSAGRALQQAKIHHSTATVTYRKIPIISPGLIFVQKAFNFAGLIFEGAYFRRDLLLNGILRFKMGWAGQ